MTFAPGRKPHYRLMPHVFVCAREDYVVLMDTEHGKYLAVSGHHSPDLTELIEGWPTPACVQAKILEGAANPKKRDRAESIVSSLLRRGLLTEDCSIGKSAAPIEATMPAGTFPIFPLDRSLRPFLRYLPNFAMACARAHWLRRQKPIARILNRVRKRRRRWTHSVVDEERLRTLVTAHHHLRPLIYTTHDACFYDSLVLIEFLATYGVDATWVFGVHTRPWIPHCWVQAGNYLLNDSPGNVGRYSVLAEF